MELSDLSPEEVPDNCRFLLEINFTELALSHLETQRYWTLTMKAALTAQHHECKRSAHLKRVCRKLNRKIPSRTKLGVTAVEHQIRADGMHCSPSSNATTKTIHHNQTTLTSLITKRPHLLSTLTSLKSNKRLRKPG
jgi:hypothetical protein